MTLASSFRDYASEIGHWWKIQRERNQDLSALRSMSQDEIRELSGELGLSLTQFEALVRAGPEAAAEMERMMAALGIDPARAQTDRPAVLREMKVNCATCGDKRGCRNALDHGTAAEQHAAFCPNSEDLAALARQQNVQA
jgi:hypothetical protein